MGFRIIILVIWIFAYWKIAQDEDTFISWCITIFPNKWALSFFQKIIELSLVPHPTPHYFFLYGVGWWQNKKIKFHFPEKQCLSVHFFWNCDNKQVFQCKKRMLLIGTDSNYCESTQMLLKRTQITTSCHINQGKDRVWVLFSTFESL